MPRIMLNIDKETQLKIKVAAKSENLSVSKWATLKIKECIKNQWPENYFHLFGKLKDDSFFRHTDLDLPRNKPKN